MDWIGVSSVFIVIGVGISILMGICTLAGVKGMVFKKLLNKIPFESKYKERIVGGVVYFILVPFFITTTLLIAGIVLTPDEVWAEHARIHAEQVEKEKEAKAQKEAEEAAKKAAEEKLVAEKRAAEEKAARHTPGSIDSPKFVPNRSTNATLVDFPVGYTPEFTLQEGKDIVEKVINDNISRYPYTVGRVTVQPSQGKVYEAGGHYYYKYATGDMGHDIKVFAMDADTGDVMFVDWTSKKVTLYPLKEFFERQQELKKKFEKEEKAQREVEKERNRKFQGLNITNITVLNEGWIDVDLRNDSGKSFDGGTLIIATYGYNDVRLIDSALIIPQLSPGESYHGRTLFLGGDVSLLNRVEAREVR